MEKTIQQKIIDLLRPLSHGLTVADVRVGLGYTSVRLDNGNIGLSWTSTARGGSCTHVPKAGTLAGMPASELLEMLASEHHPLSRSMGLACANALTPQLPQPETTSTDVMDLVDIKSSDHVVMVGFFGPLVAGIRQKGCRFDIVVLEEDRPGTISPEAGKKALGECSVAILTATSIVTGTVDELLSDLKNPRAAVILGPSSFMRPEVFAGTPVTHIAGARIKNAPAIEKIVSEGGGTMILKQHMDFETICLNS